VKSEFGLISRRLFVANALVEKQRIQLVDMHKDGCPWKKRQCDGRFCAAHCMAMDRSLLTSP